MLILGRKYKFTQLEEIRLNKKNYNINILKYKDRDPKDVLKDIKEYLSHKSISTIVLNTKIKVDDEIIKYLTSLQFEKNISIFLAVPEKNLSIFCFRKS